MSGQVPGHAIRGRDQRSLEHARGEVEEVRRVLAAWVQFRCLGFLWSTTRALWYMCGTFFRVVRAMRVADDNGDDCRSKAAQARVLF